jgi:hypothetical protein
MFKVSSVAIALILATATFSQAKADCAVTGTDPVPICRNTPTTPVPVSSSATLKHVAHKNHR